MPEGSLRKRGRSTRHQANLLTVVDLLLDLADSSSPQGWPAIQAASKTNQHEYSDLKSALVVYWDQNKPGELLVCSTRNDPGLEKNDSKVARHSKIGTLEAIRRCLCATEYRVNARKLNLQGRETNTNEFKYARDQIRNALYDLRGLELLEDKEKPNKPRSNNAYWCFWIKFPKEYESRKQDCLAYIKKKCSESLLRLKGEEAQQLGSQLESLALAKTKQRLDNLDHWVQANLAGLRQRFEARDEVRDRRIYVPLATEIRLASVDVDAAGMRSVIRELRPEDIKSVVAQNWGSPGFTDKSTRVTP